MYTNANELVSNGKDLEYELLTDESKADTMGTVQTKLNKDVKTLVVLF